MKQYLNYVYHIFNYNFLRNKKWIESIDNYLSLKIFKL